jgi:uncharacterized protein YjbI with pentapeptide repeats
MAKTNTDPTHSVEPARAAVKPRARRFPQGEVLPVEDHVQMLLDACRPGWVQITGGMGTGKSTALRHLAAVFEGHPKLVLLDAPNPAEVKSRSADSFVVFACEGAPSGLRVLELAPWGEDDWIEYLLHRHRDQCASVMARLAGDGDQALLSGNPEVWCAVLDQLAGDPSLAGVTAALRRRLDRILPDPHARSDMAAHCLRSMYPNAEVARPPRPAPPAIRGQALLLRHRAVAVLLVAQHVLDELTVGRGDAELGILWSSDLLRAVGALVEHSSDAQERLIDLLQGQEQRVQPMAASVLVKAKTGWWPRSQPPPLLKNAYLSHASWQNADLRGADLRDAHLHHADLRNARMLGANLTCAKLRCADLCGATLPRVEAPHADFTGASLMGAHASGALLAHANLETVNAQGAVFKGARFDSANLNGARLVEADLSGCRMHRTSIGDADLSGADFESATLHQIALHAATLAGAVFARATLDGCDLEYVQMPGANFTSANLTRSLLTGSIMPRADFRGATLCEAGLAEVEWEHADLRDADFTRASFHLGSSRSGKVGSIIPCEGSRTGFYTDDFNEQDFKAPEEIRKANLCGADLRGARVGDTDFYLVDLRGARYTRDQADHFRRCGAILHSRA